LSPTEINAVIERIRSGVPNNQDLKMMGWARDWDKNQDHVAFDSIGFELECHGVLPVHEVINATREYDKHHSVSEKAQLLDRVKSAISQPVKATQTEVKSTWYVEDSEVGPGTIEVEVRSTDCCPLVNLTLEWKGENEQSENWRINWVHHPAYLLTELPEYLLRFGPAGKEMAEVLKSLGLDKFETQDDSE